MNLNVRLNFGVIWYYTLPSKFRGILFTSQLEIQKSTAILEKKNLQKLRQNIGGLIYTLKSFRVLSFSGAENECIFRFCHSHCKECLVASRDHNQ